MFAVEGISQKMWWGIRGVWRRSVAASICALGVTGFVLVGGAGAAHAEGGKIYTSPTKCGFSVHGQGDGHCVWLHADPVSNFDDGWVLSALWSCPALYPYPFVGFGSDNPVWEDRSMLFTAFRMKAVVPDPVGYAARNGGGPFSWAGRGPEEPGYVAVQILDQTARITVEIDYKCSDSPSTISA